MDEEALQRKSSLVCSFLRKFIDVQPGLPTRVSGNSVLAFCLGYGTLGMVSTLETVPALPVPSFPATTGKDLPGNS